MSKDKITKHMTEAIQNFVFAGLTVEQVNSLPGWLLNNMDKNIPDLNRAIIAEKIVVLDELYDTRELVMLNIGKSAYMVHANDIKLKKLELKGRKS